MADIKLDPDEIKEKLEPVGDAVAKAGKAIARKAEPTVKAIGEKAKESQKKVEERAWEAGKVAGDMVKETGKAAGGKVKENHEKVQARARQAGREAASAVTPILYIQYGDREYACDELVERAKADYREKNKGAVRSCKLYIKPEENAAYYVISGKEGKIFLG